MFNYVSKFLQKKLMKEKHGDFGTFSSPMTDSFII